MEVDAKCLFCEQQETHDHLFFHYRYSGQVWRLLLQKAQVYRVVGTWAEEKRWCIENLGGKSFKQRLRQLVLISVVYFIWMERNSRCHGGTAVPPEVVHKVLSVVQQRAISWRGIKRTKENWLLSLEWIIDSSVFV
ncbi:hypothetical protein LIER_10779 [Lithospermum erythrorhizon]|uniref:Reverse transcriptase zinc-binding domain-containing protein n=1 Tax=Lithospermum erythrorhizon TaxID=34254 RepID=A0AAV3PLX0_LITER